MVGALRIRSFLHAATATLVVYAFCDETTLVGMETSLLFPAVALFVGLALCADRATGVRDGMWLFLAAGLVIGARLDAALFVLPVLALLPASARLRLGVFAALAMTGAVYLGVNHVLFDSAMPVSGEIKSLGAPTVNLKFAVQLVLQFRELPLGFFRGDFVIVPAILAVIGAGLIVASLRHPRAQNRRRKRRAGSLPGSPSATSCSPPSSCSAPPGTSGSGMATPASCSPWRSLPCCMGWSPRPTSVASPTRASRSCSQPPTWAPGSRPGSRRISR